MGVDDYTSSLLRRVVILERICTHFLGNNVITVERVLHSRPETLQLKFEYSAIYGRPQCARCSRLNNSESELTVIVKIFLFTEAPVDLYRPCLRDVMRWPLCSGHEITRGTCTQETAHIVRSASSAILIPSYLTVICPPFSLFPRQCPWVAILMNGNPLLLPLLENNMFRVHEYQTRGSGGMECNP